MRTFNGTETVTGGYYLHLDGWNLEAIDGAAGVLPGGASERYVRVPAPGVILLAPLLGLVFVILLPFLGAAVLIEQGWHKALQSAAARRAARVRPTTLRRR